MTNEEYYDEETDELVFTVPMEQRQAIARKILEELERKEKEQLG